MFQVLSVSRGMQSQPEECWVLCPAPSGCSELGPFTTDAAAARALAKVLGVNSTDLARSAVNGPPRSASKFQYVTSRVRAGNVYWVAQPSAGIQRQFTTQREAAQWVASCKKVSIQALAGRRHFYHQELRKRFDIMMDVCGKRRIAGRP